MGRPAHPDAMSPASPGSTRTAAPQAPRKFPLAGRYRAYTIFDWTGILYLILGFLALGMVWALGNGESSWDSLQASFRSPLVILFHVLALVGVCFVGVRFFGLFPKAQPPRLGPAKPPPASVITVMLYATWIGVTVVFALILSGGLF